MKLTSHVRIHFLAVDSWQSRSAATSATGRKFHLTFSLKTRSRAPHGPLSVS
jgi:hypothetical protein